MAQFHDLPVETITEIIKMAFNASLDYTTIFPSRKLFTDVGLAPPHKHIPETHVLQNSTGMTLFALQAARVCTLWRDIISFWPHAWRCLAFDLSKDPKLFLEAFSWSRDLDIYIYVFSSISRPYAEVEVNDESHHLDKIVTALVPHIHRCTSLTFNVAFIDSLPNPLHLVNSSAVRLIDATFEAVLQGTEAALSNSRHSFSNTILTTTAIPLGSLSMTVFAFMEIDQHLQGCVRDMLPDLHWLNLSNFSFPQPFDEDDTPANTQITVQWLISSLSRLGSAYLTLSNCSLNYTPQNDNAPQQEYDLACNLIHFNTTSGSFIQAVLLLTGPYIPRLVTITNCLTPVPSIFRPLAAPLGMLCLTLNDIRTHTAMRAILLDFPGAQLTVKNCIWFDDELLEWLTQPVVVPSNHVAAATSAHPEAREATFAAKNLEAISILDCTNFSSPALRHLIETRHIEELCVDGNVPDIGQVEREWYVGQRNVVKVQWVCRNGPRFRIFFNNE